MSNDFVSQQLPVHSQQMGQMEPVSNVLGSPVPQASMGLMGSASNNPSSQQISTLDKQMGLVATPSSSLGSHMVLMNKQMDPMESSGYNLGSHQLLPQVMVTNAGSLHPSASSKRKESVQLLPNSPVSQHLSMPMKGMVQIRPISSRPGQSFSTSNKRTAQMLNGSGSQSFPATNRKLGHTDSFSSKAATQQVTIPKGQSSKMEPSPKHQAESFESVRSKLRESLAASLEMVSQQQNRPSNVGKDSQVDQGKLSTVVEGFKSEAVVVSPGQGKKSTQTAEPISAHAVGTDHVPEKAMGSSADTNYSSVRKCSGGQSASQEMLAAEGTLDSSETWKQGVQEFQLANVLPAEDVSFSDSLFVKDELLQGNGLSWALDIDAEAEETKEIQGVKRPKLVQKELVGEKVGKEVLSPRTLAFQIEAELFQLFGGVNKKYKEKGRSLLFNLKDHSNPELRERVMSGEIPPKRLCSMTAEELASKELSQWRIAKAEELAQMVVLPDTDVDVRRLVKKTHKGEFQVEVEQDDSVSMEVSIGASSLTQIRPKGNKTEAPPSKSGGSKDEMNLAGKKGNLEDQDLPSSVAILPHEGADPMQGIEVDELKDEEFLPPIVSLDEFMESLDSEPPFENLSQETGKTAPILDKGNSDVQPELRSSDHALSDSLDSRQGKPEEEKLAHENSDSNLKSSKSHLQSGTSTPGGARKHEHIWEGLLQLSVSAVATCNGFFKSGERTSTKEWSSLLEIKGRVRLEAFEKFIHELPNSRSRAIMVLHFLLKDGSRENEQETLSEVAESYVSDERLGFAEPAPGVEVYFCPTHTRTLEMLRKHLPKECSETLNSTENGLIGVVVWRRAHSTSTISPKSSSKHGSKRQQSGPRKPQEKDQNTSPCPPASKPPSHSIPPRTSFNPSLDDEDDVPPGFGPGREEDDLPEFTFARGSNLPVSHSSRQSHSQAPGRGTLPSDSQTQQMRELIQKYGQSGTSEPSGNRKLNRGVGVGTKPWEDEDDDIPEWQPQAPQLPGPPSAPTLPQLPMHSSFQQSAHMLNQSQLGAMPVPIPQPSWGPPLSPLGLPMQGNGVQPSNLGCQANGQTLGVPMDWRQGAPRSRGF